MQHRNIVFSCGSTSLLPIPGLVQFPWLRVGSPRWGWHGPVPLGYPILGSLCAKGVFPRTLPHSLGPNSFPGTPPALGVGTEASPAAPASHLSLHESREYSRAPVLALSRIPNGIGIFGDGLCHPVWNIVPCKSLSFGSASLEKPFLPVTCLPSCAGAAQSRIPWIHFLLDPNCLLRAEAFGIFLDEPALPGSSEPASGRAWSTWICNRGGKQPSILLIPCSSWECCPLNPCSQLPQHEDSKEILALLMCPPFST